MHGVLSIAITASLLTLAQSGPDAIVEQLRDLPRLPATPRSDGKPVASEARRQRLYEEIRDMGAAAVPALRRGLRHPDVRLRRNVLTALQALSGRWWDRAKAPMNIRELLPDLIAALDDADSLVRAWSAHSIGNIGGDAVSAVPRLILLLTNGDEASRNGACIALRGIGPPARAALPALRKALTDSSKDVRGFAGRAIEAIEQR